MSIWWVYICEKSGKVYVGITTDLQRRLRQHGNPELLCKEGPSTKEEAVRRERQIKGWERDKKLQLIPNGPSKRK